ncbi:MAG: hypothetical protein WAM60_14865 [Candidatus Promineifilaceae bacterium]
MGEKTHHTAYLIRWQTNETHTHWRAVAEDAYTGEKTYFTSKNTLLHFLWQSLNDNPSPDDGDSQMLAGQ